MRNFYNELHIQISADEEEIRQAVLRNGNASDAEFVLLNENRKRVYDRAWNCLSIIGQLRANLKVDKSVHWKTNHAAFSSSWDGQPPLLDQGLFFVQKMKAGGAGQEVSQKSRMPYKKEKKSYTLAEKFVLLFFGLLFLFVSYGIYEASHRKNTYLPEPGSLILPGIDNTDGSKPSSMGTSSEEPPTH